MGKLTAIKVRNAEPGRHVDGDGLMLDVKPTGRAYWTLRFTFQGKRRDLGLGPANGADAVSLATARDLAADARRKAKVGVDPIGERAAEKAAAVSEGEQAPPAPPARTFRDVTGMYVRAHEASWRNAKHRAQWESTLDAYAHPHFGDVAVADVGKEHVTAALEPIWHAKPETASRVRGRIESVLDYAKARGWRAGENPATWRGNLAHVLPRRSKLAPVQHHAALPWQDVGAFIAELAKREGVSARALDFTILTAARSGEVRGARWGEVDMKAKVWTVPAARMKAGKEHRVPLSEGALAILAELRPKAPAADSLVFPSPYGEGTTPLSDMTLTAVLRRMKRDDLTVHGFRSTFRDWCAEATNYPREIAEAALAHTLRDKVEAAYRRGDALEKRRRLMQDWCDYCTRPAPAEGENVVPLRAAGA